MASSEKLFDLRRLWESYVRAPQENRTKKVKNLERFLKGVLLTAASMGSAEHDQENTCFPHFSDMKSVSNILAGEFLVDVQHICSTSEDDDVTQLREYLLRGRGAILLKVLNTIGVQGLSSARELGDLLVSLLPLCCRFTASSVQELPDVKLTNIESCFEHLNHVPITQPPPKYPTIAEVTPKIKQHKLVVSSYQHPNWANRAQHASQPPVESSESDSESENTQQVWPNYGMDVLYPLEAASRLGVYPGLLQEQLSSNDEPDDEMDPLGEEVHLKPIELTVLLLNLSKNLCYREGIGGPQGMAVSLALLPHLSHFLLALQTDYAQGNIPEGWDTNTIAFLERYTIRVIITVASFASLQPNGISSLAASGTLISLLEVAKQNLRTVAEKGLPESIIESIVSSPLLIASDILHGIWLLLHTIFYCIPLNPTFLNSSLKLLSEVVENQGLWLLQTALLTWEKHHSKQSETDREALFAKSHMVSIVESIGRVMTSLKRAKINYIHTMRCMKKRHKTCDFKHYMHHHHDVLGIASSAMTDSQVAMNDSYGSMEALEPEAVNPIECSAAILADLLLKVFRDSNSRLLQVRTLCCIEESGLCCCMQPARVMRLLLKPIDSQTPGIRNYTLFVLAKSLLEYCGGSDVVQLSCSICKDAPSSNEDSALGTSPKSGSGQAQETSDSALSSSDSMHDDVPSKHPKWRCLKQYLPLINHESEDISTQITQHILRLVSQGSIPFKQELFYSVFLPVMKLIKEQYRAKANTLSVTSSDVSTEPTHVTIPEGVVQYCLSALPLLLHSRSSQDLFLNYGGLKQLFQLVQVKVFRKCVLKVFQVLIMLEDKRKLREETKRTSVEGFDQSCVDKVHDTTDTTDSEPGLTTESSSGINVVEAFMKLLLHNPVYGESPTLTSLPTARLSEHYYSPTVSISSRQDSVGSGSTVSGIHSPNQFEESVSTLTGSVDLDNMSMGASSSSYRIEKLDISHDRNELTIMCDVWSACASLLPYSQSFQQSFIEADGPHIAYDLMLNCLQLVCKSSKDFAEKQQKGNATTGVKKMNTASKGGDGGFLIEWLCLLESSLVICLSSSKFTNIYQQHQLEMTAVLQKVQEVLTSSRELQGSVLKATCDTLLSCATTYRSMKDIIQNHMFAVMHLRIDDRDEVEVAELSDYCSTARDTETCHTELGYEADSEFTSDGMLNEKSSYVYRAGRSAIQLMLYPQLCKLVLQLLVDHPTERPTSGVLSHVLLKLISLAKQSAHIASAMYNQGLVEILLNGLRKIIRNYGRSPSSLVEQRLILDLFLLISQHAFSSCELKLFLALFQEEKAPVDALLSTGIQLAESFKFQPAHILAFPVFKSSLVTDLELSVRSVSSDILTASIRPVSRLPSSDASDYNLRNSAQEAIDLEATVASSDHGSSVKVLSATSPLRCAPVQMLLQDKVIWPANNRGFSISLWLRLEGLPDAEDGFMCKKNKKQVKTRTFAKASHSDTSTNRSQMLPTKLKIALKKNLANRHWSQQCCHIISLGNAQEQFQLWADPNTASLLIRLIGKPQEGEELLGELCLPGLLSFENWHHLGITFSEQINGGTTIATVVVVSDGCYQKEGTIEHRSRADMPELTTDSHVVLGQSIPSTTPQVTIAPFQLGSLMVFQDSVLTKHTCFHLYALGPDCVTLSQCDSNNHRPGYAHHISHDALLNSGIAQEVLMGGHSIYLPKIRETVIISYSPEHPNTYNLYSQTSVFKPQRNIFGGQKQARSAFEPLCHQPISVQVRQLTDLAPQVHRGLSNAVGEIGGIGVYFFLMAKIVEQNGNEYQQAKALKLLLSLKRQNPYHAEEFKAMNGYALLAKVFTSDKAIISMDLLKTMLDACLTKPLLRWDSIKQQYHLSTDSHPLIRDVHIITDLLLAWRVWDRAPLGVWKTAFEAIEVLVSGSHASCAFNVKQLQSAAIVNRLLLICLERIQEAYPCLPVLISQSIINIIRCVVGSRPEIHVVMTMCDFLLLMHPAASTYVHHEPYHFYFMQNWVSGPSLSRRSSQMSSESSHYAVNYNLRYAATIVNIPKDARGSPIRLESQSLPNLVKRSKSMPVGTSSPRKKKPDRFDELDTLLSDEDSSDDMPVRGRSLTASRTSPSSPRDSPRTSPKLSLKLSHKTSPVSLSPVTGTPSSEPSSKEVSPGASPVGTEDTVDKSVVYSESAVEEIVVPRKDDQVVEDRHKDDECEESDDDTCSDEISDSDKTHESSASEGNEHMDVLPTRKLSHYETMAEYLEEITGAKDIPPGCIASTLSSQVKEQIERRNSVSESNMRTTTLKSSLNDLSREVSISESAADDAESSNKNQSQAQVPQIEVTADSPTKDSSVDVLVDKIEKIAVREVGEDQPETQESKQQSMASPSTCNSDWELYPDVDSMKSISVSLYENNKNDMDDDEKGLVLISAGLLELLSQIVVSLPNVDLLQVLGIILKPEVLLILAHHAAPEIRANVVKLLDMYIHRATVDHVEAFIKQQGPQLLGAQLHRHSTCRELLEACFTILFGKPHTLEDDIDTNILSEMSKIQKLAVVPVFSLLESSVEDTSLCHNSLMLLIQVFDRVPSMMQTMLDNGLQETLCNVLKAINATPPRLSDLGCDERHLLIEDVQHFFTIIADKTFSTSGVIYHQYLEDGMTLLHALEQQQIQTYGVNSEEVGNVRNIECHMFRGILDYVTTQLDTPTSRILPFTRAFGSKVKDSLLSLFSDTESESLASSNEEGDNQRRSPSPQPIIPAAETSLLAPLYEGSPMNILNSGFSGSKRTDLTQGELQDRFKKMISAAVDFVLYTAPQSEVVETPQARRLASLIEDNAIEIVSFEHDFARFLIEFLVKGIVAGMERSLFQRKTLNSTIMWQTKDVLRMQFSRLFAHMLHPNEVLHQRLFALDLVANEVKCRDLLKLTVHIGVTGQKLIHFLYELLSQHLNEINNPQRDEVDELLTILSSCGFQPLRLGTKLTNQHMTSMEEERQFWDKEMLREKKIYSRRKEGAKQRIHQKLDNTAKKLSGAAMEVTQVVSHLQNQQRKKFTEHVKMEMTHRLQIKKTWQQLIQQLTHERAVWYCCKSYPKSWQLDPTEGPSRIRRRLQRCHLGVPSKFLKDKHKDKLEAERYDPPLSFLFEEDASTSDSAALIYRLFTNEKIEFTCKCNSVTPSSETPGELLIGQTSVYFVGDEAIKDANYTQVLLGNKDLLSMTLPHEEIKELHKRWYQLCDNALEIFLTNGKTSLLAFTSTRERDQTYKLLDSLELPNVIRGENLAAIQNLWLEGKLTNFEYLTQLNKIAGRSFNDLMQYPVFPFVLSCYNEDYLNLEDKTIYRNLSRPIAVQYKDRERKYVENYKWLEYEKQKSLVNGDPAEYRPEPYHYGSHYSNSGTVLHFLVRLPPFTQMFLDYQDQNFDLPDRTFHNVQTAWRLASYESTTDVKELIPEFFYLPEFLLNFEGFDFGVRQTGERVWNVSLPPWCRQNPRLFVLVNRQALESGYVTTDLAPWIDLVFGFKQHGKPAIDAVNVFHPATYFGVNVEAIEDPVRRNALKTMIKTYGQTPKQLFKNPHQVKQVRQKKPSVDGTDQPMKEVDGLKWGNYVGSPAHPEPSLAWTQSYGSVVATVVSLPTGDVFGLGPCSTLLVMYSKETDAVRIHHTDVQWAAIVSWGHPDGIIRVKNKRNSPAVNFMHWNSSEQVRCCASVPDCRLLFFGGTSGVLSMYHTKFNSSKSSDIQVFGHRQCLYGHSEEITMMSVCKPFSVLVTASMDGTAIIWDLNRLCYVRSIQDHSAGIQALAVSDTLGDIATASHTGQGSDLMVHTINGEKVGGVHCDELIHCLAYSNAPEGKSVNVLVAGLGTGVIRFWSSWDLLPVRDIIWEKFTRPIISLTFTHDTQRLYAANTEGLVAMWERSSSTKPKPVNFIPFL